MRRVDVEREGGQFFLGGSSGIMQSSSYIELKETGSSSYGSIGSSAIAFCFPFRSLVGFEAGFFLAGLADVLDGFGRHSSFSFSSLSRNSAALGPG